jgi:hypothetical protein
MQRAGIFKSEKQEFHFFLFLPQYLPHIMGKNEKKNADGAFNWLTPLE